MIKLGKWILVIAIFLPGHATATAHLPIFDKQTVTVHADWLAAPINAPAKLYQTTDGHLVFSNGLVSRTFSTQPNAATIGLEELSTNTEYLRSIRPEAQVWIDGIRYDIGGLIGQPIHNYLLKQWIPTLASDASSFKMTSYRIEHTKPRFVWMKQRHWMPKDLPWPTPGKELIFTYRLCNDNMHQPEYMKDIEVEVHYELYDHMPVFCKWITVSNLSKKQITINRFVSEILAATEPESTVDSRKQWPSPNITLDTDYNFGGMSEEFLYRSSLIWKKDSLYTTQVNYECNTPCLLEVAPKLGPDQPLPPGEKFESFRVWELLNDSWERERQTLGYRRMMRAIAPWVTESPIFMHVRSSDDASVKKAIDQCAEVGFEMAIMTFGSGFDAENESPENLARIKALANYARSKGIALGGYSLLASRHIDKESDVIPPDGQTPQFGNSPCIESVWGQNYMRKLYHLLHATGLNALEHDGSYPGDVCQSTHHPGHQGLADSQWNQFQTISAFYRWCRGKGIFLNVPDTYFLNGSNKIGMGYRETNWSLPRPQQEIIERQNIYDGTWRKTPSMGWMFVPLVEYHGGGEAATIEPLKDHLDHYGQRLANLFGAGVQACYRGPQLYDSPKTKELVTKWVNFYKKHREVLNGDIIHIRRADGRDYDAILHVSPAGKEKGLLMVYNPLEETIRRSIKVNLYYTGLKGKATIREQEGNAKVIKLSNDHTTEFKFEIPPKSQTWFVIE